MKSIDNFKYIKIIKATYVALPVHCTVYRPRLGTHCKDTIPKIRNKYSQKRNCAGRSPNFHIHVSVRDLFFPTFGLPILLKENVWTDPGNLV